MERNYESFAAVIEAQKIISANPFLEINVRSTSVMVLANHLNEYIMSGVKDFGYKSYQMHTYAELARGLDDCLSSYRDDSGVIPKEIRVILCRSQIESLNMLHKTASEDRNLKRFQFSDAMTDINSAYHVAYKSEANRESKFAHFIGKIKKVK